MEAHVVPDVTSPPFYASLEVWRRGPARRPLALLLVQAPLPMWYCGEVGAMGV